MKSLHHWRPHVAATEIPVTILTDHANLTHWKVPRKVNRRVVRWFGELQEYNLVIQHVPGKLHTAADMLSRPPTDDKGEQDNNDLILLPEEMFIRSQTDTTPEQECYDLEQEVAQAQQRQDEEMKRWKDTHQLDLSRHESAQSPRWFRGHQIVVPSEMDLRRKIINYYHDTPTAGHPGRDETIQATKRKYWWPGMNRWIEDYVKGCAPCQQNKNLTHRTHPPVYHITPDPQANPFEEIAMDLITQLPKNGPYDAILTIVDHGCTRAAIFLPCSTTITGEGIADLYLNNVYQWFGLPTKMISDRDPRFTSHFAQALTQRLGVKQNISTAYHPQTDGLSERKNQWVEQYLRFVTNAQQDDWSEWLAIASLVHNTRINATIKMAPLQALLGYLPKLTVEGHTLSSNQRVEDRAREITERRRQAKTALAVTSVDPITLDTGTELVAAALKPRRGVEWYWRLLKLPRQETQLSVLGTPSLALYTTTVEGHGTY
jgi:Integrase zinc binding domain/RNase H-like domain found in reverse transcriptase